MNTDLIEIIVSEIEARARLNVPESVHRMLIESVAHEVFEAIDNGWEFVGARGGLQYDPATGEWA